MSSISKSSTSNQLLASSEPSICIPRVFENITQERIARIFGELFGPRAIKRIDLIKRENEKGERYQRAFIHFNEWPSTSEAQAMRRQLIAGQEVKIVYDDPWFWKCSVNEAKKRTPQSEPRVSRAPFIVMEEHAPEHPRREERTRDDRHRDPRDYREDRREIRRDDRHQDYREVRRQDYRDDRREYRDDRRQDYRDDRHLRTTYDSRRDERDQRYSERRQHRVDSPDNRRPTAQHNYNAPRKPKLALIVDTSINDHHHHEIMKKFEQAKNDKHAPVAAAAPASEQESPRYSPTTPPGTPPKAASANA